MISPIIGPDFTKSADLNNGGRGGSQFGLGALNQSINTDVSANANAASNIIGTMGQEFDRTAKHIGIMRDIGAQIQDDIRQNVAAEAQAENKKQLIGNKEKEIANKSQELQDIATNLYNTEASYKSAVAKLGDDKLHNQYGNIGSLNDVKQNNTAIIARATGLDYNTAISEYSKYGDKSQTYTDIVKYFNNDANAAKKFLGLAVNTFNLDREKTNALNGELTFEDQKRLAAMTEQSLIGKGYNARNAQYYAQQATLGLGMFEQAKAQTWEEMKKNRLNEIGLSEKEMIARNLLGNMPSSFSTSISKSSNTNKVNKIIKQTNTLTDDIVNDPYNGLGSYGQNGQFQQSTNEQIQDILEQEQNNEANPNTFTQEDAKRRLELQKQASLKSFKDLNFDDMDANQIYNFIQSLPPQYQKGIGELNSYSLQDIQSMSKEDKILLKNVFNQINGDSLAAKKELESLDQKRLNAIKWKPEEVSNNIKDVIKQSNDKEINSIGEEVQSTKAKEVNEDTISLLSARNKSGKTYDGSKVFDKLQKASSDIPDNKKQMSYAIIAEVIRKNPSIIEQTYKDGKSVLEDFAKYLFQMENTFDQNSKTAYNKYGKEFLDAFSEVNIKQLFETNIQSIKDIGDLMFQNKEQVDKFHKNGLTARQIIEVLSRLNKG